MDRDRWSVGLIERLKSVIRTWGLIRNFKSRQAGSTGWLDGLAFCHAAYLLSGSGRVEVFRPITKEAYYLHTGYGRAINGCVLFESVKVGDVSP